MNATSRMDGYGCAGQKGSVSPFLWERLSRPLVPGRAVDKILSGEYIDFSELLPDNMELMRRDGERDMAAGWQSGRSPIRRLTSILSCVQAYAAFLAVVRSRTNQIALHTCGCWCGRRSGAGERAGERTTSNSACKPGHTLERLDLTSDSNLQRNFLVVKTRRDQDTRIDPIGIVFLETIHDFFTPARVLLDVTQLATISLWPSPSRQRREKRKGAF